MPNSRLDLRPSLKPSLRTSLSQANQTQQLPIPSTTPTPDSTSPSIPEGGGVLCCFQSRQNARFQGDYKHFSKEKGTLGVFCIPLVQYVIRWISCTPVVVQNAVLDSQSNARTGCGCH